MPKILCTLPNAGEEIQAPSGAPVKFAKHAPAEGTRGMLSEEISDADAESLLLVPGYEAYSAPTPAPKAVAVATPATVSDPELEALRKRGIELNIPYAGQLGVKRLRAEIAEAEANIAAAAAAAEQRPEGDAAA